MGDKFKKSNGVTLMALTVIIIVILILSGVLIGASEGIRENVKETKSNVALMELSQVQEAVMEIYIKYKQTGNEALLIGTPITYTEASEKLNELKTVYDIELGSFKFMGKKSTDKDEEKYYIIEKNNNKDDLKKLGIEASDDVIYVINYSTGEVFDYKRQVTATGKILYIAK